MSRGEHEIEGESGRFREVYKLLPQNGEQELGVSALGDDRHEHHLTGLEV